jgi:hypothetical protein
MVPFVWIRTIWMAGPASFGLLTMAGVRLGRLATYLYSGRRDLALSGGRFAGVSFLLTNTLVINAGSRFPHILVTALYALAAEQAWLLWHAPGRRDAFRHAALLGFFGGWLVTTRLSEGFLLVGIFLGVVYGLLRRQIALGPFLVAGGVSAVWFVIPFQLTAEFHPWAKLTYSPPPPDLIKWHVPLATGSYCWWPLAPGFGLAGCILGMRSRARSLVVMLGIGSLLMLVYYASITYGRGWDFGYGPRYQLQTVVPMVVGAALVWAHVGMFQDASARRVAWVLASIGVLGVASTTLPYNHQVVSDAMGVALAAQRAGLKNALVVVPPGVGRYGDYDHPKNLPLELYDQDVLLANTKDIQCLRENYSHRKLYQAAGRFPVTFQPMP